MNSVLTLIFLPFLGALIAFIAGKVQEKLAFIVAELVGLALFISSILIWMNYTVAIEIDYRWMQFGDVALNFGIYIDGLSIVMLLIATGLGFLDIHFAHDYMAEDKDKARYYAKVLFFIGGMILLVVAKDMIGMFVGWEFMGLASYLLISFWHYNSAPASAGMQAFLYTRFGDIFIFAAIGLLLYFGNTLNLIEINNSEMDKNIAFIIAVFIFIGAIGKSGQFPLYPWLMNAMEGPTTVSALIHGATMVNSGIYIVARLFDFYAYSDALYVVASIAAISAFIGATSALAQSEIKKVLAYSTMSHLSIAFIGLGVGSLAAGMTHLINHAVFKALLFLSAGAIIMATHHTKDLWKLGGLNKKLLSISFFMAIGALSLSGVAPFSGFFSKDLVLASALSNPSTNGVISTLAIVAGLLSIAYIGRVWVLTFTGKPRVQEIYENVKKPSTFWIVLPLAIMAIVTTVLSLFQTSAAEFITGTEYHHVHAEGLMPILIAGLSTLALIIYFIYYKGLVVQQKIVKHPFVKVVIGVLRNGYYVEYMITYFSKNIVHNSLSRALTYFDTHIIDATVNSTLKISKNIFVQLKRTQSGQIGDYISFMIFGIAALMISLLIYYGV